MQSPFELYRENVYDKMPNRCINQCISVSTDGFVVFGDQATCKVLNPYTNQTYSLSKDVNEVIEEDSEKLSHKRAKKIDTEEEEKGLNKDYCLFMWSPNEFGYHNYPILFTIRNSLEIKLWTFPINMGVRFMDEVADLSSLIQNSSIYTQQYQDIASINMCFLSTTSFVISINSVLYIFDTYWKEGSKPQLVINLQKIVQCSSVITCMYYKYNTLFCGTLTGSVIKIEPSLLQENGFVVSPDSLLTNSKYPHRSELHDEEKTSEPYRKEFQHSRFSVLIASSNQLFNANESIILNSILNKYHIAQPCIVNIQCIDDVWIIRDSIHISCYSITNNTNINKLSEITISEGILTMGSSLQSCQIITTCYTYKVINLLTQNEIASTSLLPAYQHYVDFSLLDCYYVPYCNSPTLLCCNYIQTAPKSTTVDYRYQCLNLLSLTFETTLPCTWYCQTVLAPSSIHNQLLNTWNLLCSNQDVDNSLLNCLFIWICHQLHLHQNWILSGDEEVAIDNLVVLRRRLLFEAMRKRHDTMSKWIQSKLLKTCDYLTKFTIDDEINEEEITMECPCCSHKCILNEQHESWCLLQCIDQYCLYSYKSVVGADQVKVCPCCQTSYLDGTKCIYCGLQLQLMKNGPIHGTVINNEFIYRLRKQKLDTEWNCL